MAMAPIVAARQVLTIQRKRPPAARGSEFLGLVDLLEEAPAASAVGIRGQQARVFLKRKRALGRARDLPTTL